jgi:hypothetical protein
MQKHMAKQNDATTAPTTAFSTDSLTLPRENIYTGAEVGDGEGFGKNGRGQDDGMGRTTELFAAKFEIPDTTEVEFASNANAVNSLLLVAEVACSLVYSMTLVAMDREKLPDALA